MADGIEEFKESLCAYNSGNFLMDDCISAIDKRVHIEQSEVNRESFILAIDIDDNNIIDRSTIGTYYDGDCFKLIDNRDKIMALSGELMNCHSDEYSLKSQEMIKKQRSANLGEKDWHWLLRKMNYNSVAAKIISYSNKRKYVKAF